MKEHQQMRDKSLTGKILQYIEDNLDRDLSLEKIAEELNYSRFYVARTFKEHTGTTLYKYIQGRRLREAARKLAETDQPIVEVALEAGYGSQQAFTQAFRRAYACTPQEYRRTGFMISTDGKSSQAADFVQLSFTLKGGRAAA